MPARIRQASRGRAMPLDNRLSAFGAELWSKLQQQPFGALAKRELELSILDAATKAGLLHNKSDAVASSLSHSLTKALTDALLDFAGADDLAAWLAEHAG